MAQGVSQFAGSLDQVGAGLVNAMRTDTRNMFAGAVTVTQPVFMGGAITAANKIADINVEMAANSLELKRQGTLYNIDQAYWQTDGLALSKMLLCQLCGLPVNENITLADEEIEGLNVKSEGYAAAGPSLAIQNRPELKVLQNTVDLTKQTTNMLKAGNLPQVLVTGGYAVSNPNTFNGFERKFGGFWNVGVLVRVPIWNWGDVKHKVRASKGATTIANLEMEEARELIELHRDGGADRLAAGTDTKD